MRSRLALDINSIDRPAGSQNQAFDVETFDIEDSQQTETVDQRFLSTWTFATKEIKDHKLWGETFKVLAFADDLLILVENPKESIAAFMLELKDLGEMAGVKINHKKTKIFTKNMKKTGDRWKSHICRREEK